MSKVPTNKDKEKKYKPRKSKTIVLKDAFGYARGRNAPNQTIAAKTSMIEEIIPLTHDQLRKELNDSEGVIKDEIKIWMQQLELKMSKQLAHQVNTAFWRIIPLMIMFLMIQSFIIYYL